MYPEEQQIAHSPSTKSRNIGQEMESQSQLVEGLGKAISELVQRLSPVMIILDEQDSGLLGSPNEGQSKLSEALSQHNVRIEYAIFQIHSIIRRLDI